MWKEEERRVEVHQIVRKRRRMKVGEIERVEDFVFVELVEIGSLMAWWGSEGRRRGKEGAIVCCCSSSWW